MIVVIGLDGKIRKLYIKGGILEVEPGNFVPDTATITINGDTQSLIDNPVYTISTTLPDGNYGDITIGGGGTTMTINNGAVENIMLASGIDAAKLADGSVSNTEFQYINTLSSNAQDQLDAKVPNTREINGLPLSSDVNVDPTLNMYSALGSAILATALNASIANTTGNVTLGNQQVRFIATWLGKDATLTGVKWYQVTQGSYTANNYNGIGLYSYSGGTLTLVASSTDDGNIWKTASGTWGAKAFSSTYPATAGLYFIALLYCRSAEVTAPTMGVLGTGVAGGVVLDFTNSAKISCTLASQTALPTPQVISGLSASSSLLALGLY